MNRKDRLTKKYIGRNDVFADVVNHICFNGEPIVSPESLKSVSTEEWANVMDSQGKKRTKGKNRDLLRECIVKKDEESTYVIFGIENQSYVNYGMPVKAMLYDALNYDGQIQKIRDKNKTEKKLKDSAAFLSGMTKDDKIKPVITITVYFGAEEWDGPTSLREMFDTKNEKILSLVNDYRVNLISPQNAGNPYPVSMDAKMVFYGNSGMSGSASDDNYCLDSGKTAALLFYNPDEKRPNSYNMTYTLKSSYEEGYADCKSSGSIDYITFSYPYDDDYEKIIPASSKVYINYAY